MLVITLHSQLHKESLEIVLLDVILQNHHGAPEKWYSFCQIDTGNCVTDHKVSLLELITEKLSQPYHFLWQVCWFYSIYFTIKLISNSHLHNYPSFTFLLIYFFPLSYLSQFMWGVLNSLWNNMESKLGNNRELLHISTLL